MISITVAGRGGVMMRPWPGSASKFKVVAISFGVLKSTTVVVLKWSALVQADRLLQRREHRFLYLAAAKAVWKLGQQISQRA